MVKSQVEEMNNYGVNFMKTFAEWPLFSLLTGIVLAKTDSTGRVQNVVV